MEYKNDVLKLSEIGEPPHQLRMVIDEKGIDELALSIGTHGLINPITVQQGDDGKIIIVAGHRRFLACKKLGWAEMPVRFISEAAPETVKVLATIENIERKDLNPIEEADLVGQLHYEAKIEIQDIAGLLGRSPAWVQRRLNILQFPKEILDALMNKVVSIGVAETLSTVEAEATRNYMLEQSVASGASVATVQGWIKELRTNMSIEEAHATIDALREMHLEDKETTQFTCVICGTEEPLSEVRILRACQLCALELERMRLQTKRDEKLQKKEE